MVLLPEYSQNGWRVGEGAESRHKARYADVRSCKGVPMVMCGPGCAVKKFKKLIPFL